MKAKLVSLFLFTLLFMHSTIALAVVAFPDFKMTISKGVGQSTLKGAILNLQDVNGTEFSTMGTQSNAMWMYNWNLTVDPDPVIGGTFDITNLTGVTRTFSILFDLPTSVSFSPAVQSGFIEALLEDKSGTTGLGVSGAFANNVVWNGRIDGANTLGLGPFSPSCSGIGCSDSLSRQDAGPDVYGPGLVNDIGIGFSFELSPGDKFSFTTEFEVQPVPIPAALPLFATGLVGLWGLMRKTKTAAVTR